MTVACNQLEDRVVNGQFHLRKYLGGSERSVVFLAERVGRPPEEVAIKFIPSNQPDAELRLARWEQATALSHPHLIRLFDTGLCQLDGTDLFYVVMEYAEEDLSQILPLRPLTPAEVRDMLKPALDALAYIHSKGFVHGRFKPSNIMARGERVKISSDTISRGSESRKGFRRLSVYDAPETVNGVASTAEDVWSLGVTLIEALTQRTPGWDKTPNGIPEVPTALAPPFFDIARHCLRRDPQRRWTVSDIRGQLHPTPAEGVSPELPMPPTLPSALKPSRLLRPAHPTKSFGKQWYFPAATVALALVVLLPGLRLLTHHSTTPDVPAVGRNLHEVEMGALHKQLTGEEPKGNVTPYSEDLSDAAVVPPTAPANDGVRHEVLPAVPESAKDTIQGTVRVSVRVSVDPSGDVTDAEIDSPGPSRYFARLALEAARQWKFGPLKDNGRGEAWILRFEFMRTDTNVFSQRIEGR